MRYGSKPIVAFFAGLLLSGVVVAGTIAAVDPFHYFRWSEPPHLAILMQRHSTAGQIRNTVFDTVILGNSTAAHMNQSAFAGFPEAGRIGNLSMWGATLQENAITLELALRKQKIRKVIWLIGNQALAGYRSDDFPYCMYDARFELFPYCYLFNVGIFQEAVELALPFLDYQNKPSWHTDLQTWKTYLNSPMNVPQYICDLTKIIDLPSWQQQWDDADFNRLDDTETAVFSNFKTFVLPLIDAHPEIEFTFVFPPVYRLELVRTLYQNAHFTISYMALVEHGFLARKNVRVFDFRFSDLADDPAEYLDEAHFSAVVADEMVRRIARGEQRITSTPEAVRTMVAGTEAAFRELGEEASKLGCGLQAQHH